jgi:8-amino-3,8-dideoxy-alpha-D-manno-octulosonate transaminase
MPGYELIGKEERQAIEEIFDNGAVFFAHGFHEKRKGKYHVREFEATFAKKVSTKHALALSSGTAALKVGLRALGVKPGDEVITQAFTFIATVEAILDMGAKPVMTNVDESLNMCAIDLRKKISSKTRAIIPVHMLGFAANIEEICSIAKKYNIPVLEDNCEAIGAHINGKALGTFGDIGVISLDFGKTITTGEGGIAHTNNPSIDKVMREYHDHGHENNPNFPRGRDTRSI